MKATIPAAAVAVTSVLVVAAVVLWPGRSSAPPGDGESDDRPLVSANIEPGDHADEKSREPSPFDVVGGGDAMTRRLPEAAPVELSAVPDVGVDTTIDPDAWFDVAALGASSRWSDDDFRRAAARLRADPQALTLVIEAFRAETDPIRLARLASLLGEVGHPDLVSIGTDMASSGNVASRDAGLALLGHLQADDGTARDALVTLLASESDPAVLKSLIDAVSVPGEEDDASGRGALVAQLVPLTRHESAAVRRNGITVLARWSADESITPVLRAALDDEDEAVRDSAVYAFATRPPTDEAAKAALFTVLENTAEREGTRAGALLALQRSALDDEQARRLEAARRELSRRRPSGGS